MFRFYSVLSVRKLETAPTVLVRVPKMRPSKMVSFLVRETCLVRNIDRTSATTFRSGGEVSKLLLICNGLSNLNVQSDMERESILYSVMQENGQGREVPEEGVCVAVLQYFQFVDS